ncbi:MAG TPA: HD domain-containing protein [Acidimicrobiales bacterium]
MNGWRHASHLIRRFAGALRPGGPPAGDEAWARRHLLPGEQALWGRMSGADRRHAVGVARRSAGELGALATRPVVAAALLHDVGKVDSGLGPVRRAVATLAGLASRHAAARRWRHRRGPLGRAGRYLSHDEIGAGLLSAAGSDALTVAWAREHHLPPDRWTVPPEVGAALKAADDD